MKRHVDVGADILSLGRFPVSGRADRALPSRELGRQRLSRGRRGRRHSDRRAHSVGGRLLRRADVGSAVPAPADERSGDRHPPRAPRHDVRSRRRRCLHQDSLRGHGDGGRRAWRVEVLQQINRSLQGHPAPEPVPSPIGPGVGAAGEVLAFVSLARITEGSGSTSDVLALSTSLIRNIAPGASGAWFLVAEGGDHLAVAYVFRRGGAEPAKADSAYRRAT